MTDKNELVNVDPQDYFKYVKDKKNEMTDVFLKNLHVTIENQINKAMVTGQNLMIRRLAYSLGVIEREYKLLDLGINVFVLREDIEYFIDKVADKAVKVTEMELYPREIPDELVQKVQKLREEKIFDNFYVVFTDYTGETTKEVKKERIRKDPILFGVFEQKIDNLWDICDRFYFIGDWEDEYCDLTLTKMVQKMSEHGKKNIVENVAIPKVSADEVRSYVNRLEEISRNGVNTLALRRPVKKSFLQKVQTVWKTLTEK